MCQWTYIAEVAELVDAHVSGACAARCTGSSPVFGTFFYLLDVPGYIRRVLHYRRTRFLMR